MNDPWRNEEPISIYTLAQGIADGLYVEIFKNRWKELSAGKPIVATTALCEAVSLAALREIWNAYVVWRREVMPTLPVAEHLFATTMNEAAVWVIEDEQAYTLLFPEDY